MTEPTAATIDAATRLAAVAADAWDSQMNAHPVYATAIGDRRFDDRLRVNGPGAVAADAARLDALLGRVADVDPAALSPDAMVTRSALVDFLRAELDLTAAGMEAWSVDPLDGPQVADLNIPSFQPVRTTAEEDALVARWREMGPWLDRLVGTNRSRLITGTGKYKTYELMRECMEASGCEVTTVAVRRERLIDKEGKSILDFL